MDFNELHTLCKDFDVLKTGLLNLRRLEAVFHATIQESYVTATFPGICSVFVFK